MQALSFILKTTNNIEIVKLSAEQETSHLRVDVYKARELKSIMDEQLISTTDLYILMYDAELQIIGTKVQIKAPKKYHDRISYLFQKFANSISLSVDELQTYLKGTLKISLEDKF